MRTLADDMALVRGLLVHPETADHPFDPSCRHVEVYAPCCGRKVAADSVLDVRGVAGTIVAGAGHLPPRDHDYLCDGCSHRLVIDPRNDWSWSKLYSSVGAHPETVRHHLARERADEAARLDFAAGRSHRPDDAFAAALAALPPGIDPHATRKP